MNRGYGQVTLSLSILLYLSGLQKLKAAKNAVGLHALHEDRKRLPEECGNLVKGLAKGVVELCEHVVDEGGALVTDATKGFDADGDEGVTSEGEGIEELVVLVVFSGFGTCSRPLRAFFDACCGE